MAKADSHGRLCFKYFDNCEVCSDRMGQWPSLYLELVLGYMQKGVTSAASQRTNLPMNQVSSMLTRDTFRTKI